VPARGSRLERELGLRRVALRSPARRCRRPKGARRQRAKGLRRLLAAARRQRPP